MKQALYCMNCRSNSPGAVAYRCKGCDKLYCEGCLPHGCHACGEQHRGDEPWYYLEGEIGPKRTEPPN